MIRTLKPNLQRIAELSLLILVAAFIATAANAADAGRVKVVKGAVQIERDGKSATATVGTPVQVGDTIKTGANGSVGITFQDDSLLSVGPNSVLSVDRFVFDNTTHKGEFDTSLKRGTLTAVSGKLVKEQPESMRVKTPAAIMGVRGTEFAVKVADRDSGK
ncbi:MAG: FecR family protein [Burkholderiales bacterium]